MSIKTSHVVVAEDEPLTGEPVPGKSRDASNTRMLLLQAARRHFARDGYTAATVREIAAEAGVNVALINRYFVSKEGLFEACLTHVAEDLDRPDGEVASLEQMIGLIVNQMVDSPSGERQLQLMLLLRTSGDQRADQIRRNTLHMFAGKMATAAGWRENDPRTRHLILGAQLVLSTALGVVLLRTSVGVEPLSSATEEELRPALAALIATLLSADIV